MSCQRLAGAFVVCAQESTGGAAVAITDGDAGEDQRNTAAAFQLDRHINVAVKMLSLDPNLAKIHARLISKMPERTFWYHYFSRVAGFRAELDLEPLCEDLSKVCTHTLKGWFVGWMCFVPLFCLLRPPPPFCCVRGVPFDVLNSMSLVLGACFLDNRVCVCVRFFVW